MAGFTSMSTLLQVFVYGTLKSGEPNHHWLTTPANGVARLLGNGKTAVKYPLVIASRYNIPFLLDEPGRGHQPEVLITGARPRGTLRSQRSVTFPRMLGQSQSQSAPGPSQTRVLTIENIAGEVYEIDEKMLSNLDILEGYPTYYTRRMERILTGEGGEDLNRTCWAYFLQAHKPHLLQLPMLQSYSSSGDHGLPYLERYRRDPHFDYTVEVQDKHTV